MSSRRNPPQRNVSEHEIFLIFREDRPLKEIVERNADRLFVKNSTLENYVKQIGRKIKRAQLRKFYNYVRSLESQWKEKPGEWKLSGKDRLKLLKINVYLSYAVGRGLIPKDSLDKLFNLMIERIKTYEDFRALIDVFEAIVAYHVYHFPKG